MKPKSKLNRKMVLISEYTLFIILVLVSAGIIIFIGNTYKNNTKEQLYVMTNNIANSMNQSVQNLHEISLQLSFNDNLISLMKQITPLNDSSNYFSHEVLERTKFSKLALSYVVNQESITRVVLFNQYSDYLYAGNLVEYDYNQQLLQRYATPYEELFRTKDNLYTIEITTEDPLYTDDQSSYVIFTRPMIDYFAKSTKTYGYVQLFMPVSTLCNGLIALPDEYEGYLIYNDSVIFQTAKEANPLITTPAGFNGVTKNDSAYVSTVSIANTPFSVLLIHKDTNSLMILLLSLSVAVLLIVAILLVTYYIQSNALRKILTPLRELSSKIESQELHIGKDILKVSSDGDELDQLSTAFNDILHNLYESFDQILLAKKNEMNSYIYTLRSQMDPHFIHNTLTVIESLSYEGKNRKIEEMCEKLSSIIRYNSSMKDNTSTLMQEVTSARHYLELMDIRYEDNLHWSIHCDNFTEDHKIPQFVLQPLIENAFVHGLKAVEFPWHIDIQARSTEVAWHITISDNGGGIEALALADIQRSIHRIQNKDIREIIYELEIGGLTLPNICARLYEEYGNNTIFELQNTVEGFSITIGSTLVSCQALSDSTGRSYM